MLKKAKNQIISMFTVGALMSGLMISTHCLKAAGPQAFTKYAFSNPAMMNLICENFYITGGAALLISRGDFKGRAIVNNAPKSGKSKTKHDFVYPLGQIMYRAFPKIVIGGDISTPQIVPIHFKGGPADQTKTILHSQNYSPKISFEVIDNLTIGAGLDILNAAKGRLEFIGPTTSIPLKNKATGTKTGWDVGLLYKAAQATWIGASYHSKIKLKVKGKSYFSSLPSTDVKITAYQPDVISLNLIQCFSKDWSVELTGRYILWKHTIKNLDIMGTPIPGKTNLSFPMNPKNSWYASICTRYQFAEKWAGIAFFAYDSNPQPKRYRTLTLPAGAIWLPAAGIQFMPTESTKMTFSYGVAMQRTKLDNIYGTKGKFKLNSHNLQLELTYKI